MSRLRVLLVSPYVSKLSTGEAFIAFKWAEALQDLVDLTVLSFQSPRHTPLQEQLPRATVITWPQIQSFQRAKRFAAMLKPEWPIFMAKVSAYLSANAENFDIGHQIMPQAMRYSTPFAAFGLPYVIGPLGGSLATPSGFAQEMGKAKWYTRLRAVDSFRLRHDPWLRRGYKNAELVLGVAPYVRDHLADIPLKRYANVLELGIDDVVPFSHRPKAEVNRLRLLHVGRGVRTKGLRDAIRAMALLKDQLDLTLTSAGEGEDIDACRQEAARLGIADRVRFLGLRPRAEIESLYAQSDVFLFPSFREPAGNVLYEAMRWGLPVITAARGGPDFIVDESTGIRVPVTTPDRFAKDIAAAIQRLAGDQTLRERMGEAGRAKVAREGLWPIKAQGMVQEYHRCLQGRQAEFLFTALTA
jgi:glycosyltransferase involved in cell wall biosynthesis